MPAFLVELPAEEPGQSSVNGANKMVIFASNSADALAAAQGQFSGDPNAMWAGATATQIISAPSLVPHSGYILRIVVEDASPVIDKTAKLVSTATLLDGGIAVAEQPTIVAGGTGYSDNDILTVVGGTVATGGRAATMRVVAQTAGVIDAGGVDIVDPGDYAVAPTPLVANAVTGGGGSGATMTLVLSTAGYETLIGRIVTLLNQDAQIAGAAIDMSEGGTGVRLLTISSVGDALGDLKVVEFMGGEGGINIPGLLSTVVDEGIAAAVLTIAIPASPIIIPTVTPVQG